MPQPPRPRSRRAFALFAVFAGTSALPAAAAVAVPHADGPRPIAGRALPKTNLALLVAADPPFVVDVDSRKTRRVTGIPGTSSGVLYVTNVGGRGAVVATGSPPGWALYGIRDRRAPAASLETGTSVAAASDGRGVWVTRSVGATACELRLLQLDGRAAFARPFPCGWKIDAAVGGALGIVAGRTRVIDPRTGREVLRTRFGVLGIAGRTAVLVGPGHRFTVLDARTNRSRVLRWPSIVDSLDAPAVDPRGRFLALAFANPSWAGGGDQVMDVWVLRTKDRSLTHLPGMPAFVALKETSIEWTRDGRLVILGADKRGEFVAVWRPGQARLALKRLQLPDRNSGSDTFAPIAASQ